MLHVSTPQLIRGSKIAISALMVLMFFGTAWFLYRNVYQPLTQATAIAELRAKVALVTVNRQVLTHVLQHIEKKKKVPPVAWDTVQNIFDQTRTTAP